MRTWASTRRVRHRPAELPRPDRPARNPSSQRRQRIVRRLLARQRRLRGRRRRHHLQRPDEQLSDLGRHPIADPVNAWSPGQAIAYRMSVTLADQQHRTGPKRGDELSLAKTRATATSSVRPGPPGQAGQGVPVVIRRRRWIIRLRWICGLRWHERRWRLRLEHDNRHRRLGHEHVHRIRLRRLERQDRGGSGSSSSAQGRLELRRIEPDRRTRVRLGHRQRDPKRQHSVSLDAATAAAW